jgi:hypothetical protein
LPDGRKDGTNTAVNKTVKKFRELYCERNEIAADDFERVLLRRGLHRRAKLVYWLLAMFAHYRDADLEFIRSVGALTNLRSFNNLVFDFHTHSHNRWYLRRVLRLRVSTRRVYSIFDHEMKVSNSTPSAQD